MNVLLIGRAPYVRALRALFGALPGCEVRWRAGGPADTGEPGFKPDLVLCDDSPGADGGAQVAQALRAHAGAPVALLYLLPPRRTTVPQLGAAGRVIEFHRPCPPA